jgi:hypothetical protein
VGYEITSGKQSLLDIGDMAHSWVVSLKKPEWTMQFDIFVCYTIHQSTSRLRWVYRRAFEGICQIPEIITHPRTRCQCARMWRRW